MAITNVIKSNMSTDMLIWKWTDANDPKRKDEIRFGSQLIVLESQEAVFFYGGKVFDVFGPGTYTLSTQNLPLLSQMLGVVFGGDSPFQATVYFINKVTSFEAKWGLSPFNMIDPNFKVPIPVTARGNFAVKINDGKKFLIEIVGTSPEIDTKDLREKFRGIIATNVKRAIFQISKEQGLSPVELEGIVFEVSDAVKKIITDTLAMYGLAINHFLIEAIPVIDDDERVKNIVEKLHKIWSEDMEERMRLKRHGENLNVYKTERVFDTTETAAANLGSGEGGSGILGTFVGLNMAASMGGQLGNIMTNALGQNSSPIQSQLKACTSCGIKIPGNAVFCPACGKSQVESEIETNGMITCDKCGSQSPSGYNFCIKCGDPFVLCPSCKKDNPSETQFCTFCGSRMKTHCPKCDNEITTGAIFCGKCGEKLIKGNI